MGQHVVIAEGVNADTYGKLIKLNESAALLWNHLKGKDFTIEDAADFLVDTYGVDRQQAVADATRIIDLMAGKELIENA